MPRAGPERERQERSPGSVYVEMRSFKEAFDHLIGKGGRRETKRFHERLIRKVDVHKSRTSASGSVSQRPLRTPASRSDFDVGRVVVAGTSP